MNSQRAEASFDWATLQAIQEVLQHCAGDAIAGNASVAKKIVIGFVSKVHYAVDYAGPEFLRAFSSFRLLCLSHINITVEGLGSHSEVADAQFTLLDCRGLNFNVDVVFVNEVRLASIVSNLVLRITLMR